MKSTALLLGAGLALVPCAPTQATVIYGSLSNFDCINDTGSTARGFEIELDGCTPSNVIATFGAPYNRYGDPSVTTDGTNTFVRYAATYSAGTSSWSIGTDTGTYAPTGGHSLFYELYGGTAGYPGTIPGDHFGIALNATLTNTVYHWLLDDGTGQLVQAGTSVRVPAPVFTVPAPAQPVVNVAVPAPPIEDPDHPLFGDAIWAKVFITTVENPEPVELHHLVLGDPVVPPDPETETEIEWVLLQTGLMNERSDDLNINAGNAAVTRRYEFYAYKGDYDSESHEALNDAYDPLYVGDFLGNQNVAVNLIPEPATGTLLGGGLGLWLIGGRRKTRSE